MFEKLKTLVINKSFLLGAVVAVGTFSHYIFGDNNLAEELAEYFVFETTGKDVNFSPTPEAPNETIDAVIKNWEGHK